MQDAGIDLIPSNDFSLYDQVLDTIALVGAVPERYGHWGGDRSTSTPTSRWRAAARTGGVDVTAMEMTKWFDTNYHYIVPELGPETEVLAVARTKPFDEHAEAMEELGIDTVPVLVGPVSLPAARQVRRRRRRGLRPPRACSRPLLEVYGEVLERLAEQGATWVQLDEPVLRRGPLRARARRAPARLRGAGEGPRAHPDRASRPTSTTSATPTAVLRDLPVEGDRARPRHRGAQQPSS